MRKATERNSTERNSTERNGRKSGAVLLLLLAGVGAAAYAFMPSDVLGQLGQAGGLSSAGAQQLDSASRSAVEVAQRAGSSQAGSSPAAIAASAPRVFSPTTPLMGKSDVDTKAGVRMAAAPSDAAGRPSTGFVAPLSAEPSRRLASSKPADDDARRELTRDLQKELKRVGCFEGEVNGTWTPASKKAMSAFMDRVNATLPVEDPDYILLTLVQGHAAQACGKGCPPGQGLSGDGRCQPRAILAQTARKSDERKVADRIEKRPVEAKTAEAKSAESSAVQTGSTNKSTWTTATVVEGPKASANPATALPGRMAMGAPVPSPDETAKLDDIEARKRRAQAALIEEQKLQAKAQVESERLKAERLAADADRRERLVKTQAETDRLQAERRNADADRRDKQVAAADARRSAQRQAEALEASAKVEPEKAAPEALANDSKASDAAKVAAVAAAAIATQEANERRIVARRAREAREREQERADRERERRVAAAAPPPAPVVRRAAPPVQTYRPTVARAPAPTPRPAPEQRWTKTIFNDISRSR